MKKDNIIYLVLIFIIQPIIALYFAINSFARGNSRKILLLFFAYWGFNFIPYTATIDANTYVQRLELWRNSTWNDLWQFVYGIVSFQGQDVDFGEELIYFIVNLFGGGDRVLFAVFAFVFGFFYLRVINNIIVQRQDLTIYPLDKLMLVAMFLLVSPSVGVNQFRFYTAAMLLANVILNFQQYSRIQWGSQVLLAVFIHFGMYLFVAPIVIFSLLGEKPRLFLFFALGTYFINFDSFIRAIDIAGYLEGGLSEKLVEISNDQSILNKLNAVANNNWYAVYWDDLLLIGCIAFYLIVISQYYHLLTKKHKEVLSILLLSISMINIASFTPLVDRYIVVLGFMTLGFSLGVNSYIHSSAKNFGSICLLLFGGLKITMGILFIGETLSLNWFFISPLIASLVDMNYSLGDLIGL